MKALKSVAFVIGFAVFYFGLMFLSGLFCGAGHGSYYFFNTITAPFSIPSLSGSHSLWVEFALCVGLFQWLAIPILLARQSSGRCKTAAAVLLGLHYLGVVVVSFETDWGYVERVWSSMSELVLLFLVGYLSSQLFMWFLILRRRNG